MLLVLMICAIIIGYYFYMKLPKKVTGYHGLELGMNAGELKYRKGTPDRVVSKKDFSSENQYVAPIYQDNLSDHSPSEKASAIGIVVRNPVNSEAVDTKKPRILDNKDLVLYGTVPDKLPKGSKVEDYEMWRYYKDDMSSNLDAKFDVPDGRIVEIACFSTKENFCERVNGIGINSTESDVKKKLGEPSKETIDDLVKKIEYKNYNLEFYLAKEKVFYIIVRAYED